MTGIRLSGFRSFDPEDQWPGEPGGGQVAEADQPRRAPSPGREIFLSGCQGDGGSLPGGGPEDPSQRRVPAGNQPLLHGGFPQAPTGRKETSLLGGFFGGGRTLTTIGMPFGIVYPKRPCQAVADFIDLPRKTGEKPVKMPAGDAVRIPKGSLGIGRGLTQAVQRRGYSLRVFLPLLALTCLYNN